MLHSSEHAIFSVRGTMDRIQ